jgi:RNA polymerase sigma-70 factor (ECF subfamily)
MDGRDATEGARKALADGAEPLRQSLAGYFRRRVQDASEVDDLVQEVFTRLLTRESTAPVEHLEAYVFQTAGTVLADRRRRRQVRRSEAHVSFDVDRHGEHEIGPERVVAARQRLRAARDALMMLPERTRAVFVLHRLEGRRYREIASQLGISVSSVEKHMARAVRHLMLHVEDDA